MALHFGCLPTALDPEQVKDYLHLPSIPKEKKLPVILSREEIWRMLQSAELLKHRILIGLIYGCGLRCIEVRNIELKHLDFDRKLLHIVQSKGEKDCYVHSIPFLLYAAAVGSKLCASEG